MEGPLILVPRALSGREDIGPGIQALADALGEAPVVEPEVAAVRAALAGARCPVVVAAECAAFPPPPGGPSAAELRAFLAGVAARNDVVGLTIASVAGPIEPVLSVVEPLL